MTDEITNGELSRGFATIREDLRELGKKIEARPSWQDVRRLEQAWDQRLDAEKQARMVYQDGADKAIKDLEDGRTYLVRWAGGAVGSAVLSILVVILTRGA